MVAKTSRCLMCRARKIKCDQRWPRCGQCTKSKRECPGPPTTIKFLPPETSKPASPTTAIILSQDNSAHVPSTQWMSYSEPQLVYETTSSDESGNTTDNPSSEDLTPVLSPALNASSANLVAIKLVKTLQVEGAHHNPAFLGSFVKDVPYMLDQSPALTATVACALDACTKKELLPQKSRKLDAALYGKALAAIHTALESPAERTCISTFLSVVLLGRLETVLATRQLARIPCWSVHAAGISALLRYRGVFDPSDDTVFHAVLENFGPIVAHHIVRDQDCFLAAPEWQESLFPSTRKRTVTPADDLLYRVFAQLAHLPTLLKYFKVFRRGRLQDDFARTMDLAALMSMELRAIGSIMDKDILTDVEIGPVSEEDAQAPVDAVYLHPSPPIVRLIAWHAVLSNIVDKVLIALVTMAQDGSVDERSRTLDELRSHALAVSKRVWMLCEEARQKGLIQFYFYPGVLAATYDSAEGEGEREWIVGLLNDVQGGTWEENLWTHEAVRRVCLTLGGQLD
ncbi:hypothetical protein PRZ48_006470 [Zasmidium cellare]|uniref:Zn(2)-C6 fungal-type domain-containing protein n=1 Tax=Zasmidium cellare TaxID=395010 RepID=A0ABR0EPC7_ZASCE|nr:hypothetical protein PRZ48_006470 [Zasmidium cellare]